MMEIAALRREEALCTGNTKFSIHRMMDLMYRLSDLNHEVSMRISRRERVIAWQRARNNRRMPREDETLRPLLF